MMKYSVIIPIYNSEKYLHRCIDSVLAQTAAEFELILIDDGSVDKSGDICREYQKKDGRVKYIKKENAGVSAARNTGIEAATGEYIGFVDSDDEICPDMYEILLSLAGSTGADVVICDATTVYSNGQTEEDTLPGVPSGKLMHKGDIKPEHFIYMAGSACRCIYNKALFEDKNVRFPAGIKLSEDRIFNILAIGNADSIYYEKKPLYLRHVVVGSAVNKYHKDYFKTVINAAEKTEESLKYCGFSESFLKMYGRQTVNGAISAIYNEFHRDCPHDLATKRKNIKAICSDETVQKSITEPCTDFKFKLIKNKHINLLTALCLFRRLIGR